MLTRGSSISNSFVVVATTGVETEDVVSWIQKEISEKEASNLKPVVSPGKSVSNLL